MSKLQMVAFCATCLLAALGISALLFPYAAMPSASVQQAHTAQPMEALPDVDLGPNFGPVPVTELVGYYLEHPPQPKAAVGGNHEQQFGGC